ncbi:CCA tRNA nucleotidyltransferase [Candidatus Daviesbacteria bacterium]|nr:CCA tRNA nucleotidyltransferase [Candidatus Daviesbacteria bacterium]
MEIILPEDVYKVINKFLSSGFKAYLVGGGVRDILMKREAKDWDLTTDAKPGEILKLFPEGFYNNKFGTVGVPMKTTGDYESRKSLASNRFPIIEITTMRSESDYKDSRHPEEVSWTDDINKDLARRDFTINAIALEISKNSYPKIIDPFKGQPDLNLKLIRAVGDPDVRFAEDALRLMRALRLAAQLNFKIEASTFESLKKNAFLIKNISWERIRDELFKILESDNAYDGLIKLKDTGLLEIILPEVTECFGIVQEGPRHDRIYDIGEHLFLSLKFCPSKNPLVRFAALIHDIGKVQTFKKDENGNVTFYGHETVGANLSKKVSGRLRLSKAESETRQFVVL